MTGELKNTARAVFFSGAWLQLGTAVTGQGPPSTTVSVSNRAPIFNAMCGQVI